MSQMVEFFRRVVARAKNQDSGGGLGSCAAALADPNAPISSSLSDFDPDHPVSPGYKKDRLGFQSVANMLASSLLTQASSRGLVVSIEGAWGSGKSSLVNLLEHDLKLSPSPPEIVRFEPWLVGDRDGMLLELMSDLASAVASIEARASRGGEVKDKAKSLANTVREYATLLSRRSIPIARFAEAAGIPGSGLAANVLEAGAEALESTNGAKSVFQAKTNLMKGLRGLDRRIIVIIDDMDRLEPDDSAEITRLIKAVADFPNIIYILCYDPTILSASLSTAISVEDGAAFLEKIVQVTFKVPKPEALDLRSWLLEDCVGFFSDSSRRDLSDDERKRLHWVCDVEGQLLKTPRDVVRTLNAVRLHWPPILEKVDYADLVWLQMVKLRSEDLYKWIERYLVEYASFVDGCVIDEDSRKEMALELKDHMPDKSAIGPRSLYTFRRFVPGIKASGKAEELLFNRDQESVIAERENKKLMSSVHHFRYYFSFSKSSGSLDDAAIYRFISAASEGEALEGFCIDLIGEKRPQGGTKFDLLIDRLNRLDDTRMPVGTVPSVLMALANCTDRAGVEAGRGQWGRRWSWDSAGVLFGKLMKRLDEGDRARVIDNVFGSGEAIG